MKKTIFFKAVILAIHRFPGFILILLAPRTICRLFKVIFLTIFNNYKFCLSILGFRANFSTSAPFYYVQGRTIRKYGTRGYVFEEALGHPLKSLFWFSSITQVLFEKIGVYYFSVITFLLCTIVYFFLGYTLNIPWLPLLITLLILLSTPLFIYTFLYIPKPEILGWPFFFIGFYYLAQNELVLTTVFFLLTAFIHFSVVFIFWVTAVVWIGINLLLHQEYSLLLILVLPAIKAFYDLLFWIRYQGLKWIEEGIGGRKSSTRKGNHRGFSLFRLSILLIFLPFPIVLSFTDAPLELAIISFLPFALLTVNYFLFRFADDHTMYRLYFFMGIVLSFLYFHSAPYLLIIFVLTCFCNFEGEIYEKIIKFPELKIRRDKRLKQLINKYFHLPKKARLLFEVKYDGANAYGFGAHARIYSLIQYYLQQRHIEMVPDYVFLRMNHPKFYLDVISRINDENPTDFIVQSMEYIGTNYIMAHSEGLKKNLTKAHFSKIIDIPLREFKDAIDYPFPEMTLTIFTSPKKHSIITPKPDHFEINPNRLEFEAKKDTEYLIRYNYHPNFSAQQKEKNIPIEIDKGKLPFMRVKAVEDGKIKLQFKKSFV